MKNIFQDLARTISLVICLGLAGTLFMGAGWLGPTTDLAVISSPVAPPSGFFALHMNSDNEPALKPATGATQAIGHSEDNGKAEILFAVARQAKNTAMPTGWCDNETYDPSNLGDTNGGLQVYQFETGEYYYESIHLPHWVDFSKQSGLLDWDIHFWIPSTATGDIVFKISLWHLYAGRTIDALTPDKTYTKTITVSSGTAYYFSVAYVADAIDLSAWETNRTLHDSMLYKIERLAAGNTLTGSVDVLHQELWFPDNGTRWTGM